MYNIYHMWIKKNSVDPNQLASWFVSTLALFFKKRYTGNNILQTVMYEHIALIRADTTIYS